MRAMVRILIRGLYRVDIGSLFKGYRSFDHGSCAVISTLTAAIIAIVALFATLSTTSPAPPNSCQKLP